MGLDASGGQPGASALVLWEELPRGVTSGAELAKRMRHRRRVQRDVSPRCARRPATEDARKDRGKLVLRGAAPNPRRALPSLAVSLLPGGSAARQRAAALALARAPTPSTVQANALPRDSDSGALGTWPLRTEPRTRTGIPDDADFSKQVFDVHGDRHRPQLLRELEEYISAELPLSTTPAAKLRVLHEAFSRFIDGFGVYAEFLTLIKDAYHERLSAFEELQRYAEEMERKCAMAAAREAEGHARMSREVEGQLTLLDARATALQRAYEDCRFDLEKEQKLHLEEKKYSQRMQKMSETVKQDKDRLTGTLSHLTTVNEELKQKLAENGEMHSHYRADMEARISGLLHDKELVVAEVDDLKHRVQALLEAKSGSRRRRQSAMPQPG